MKTLVFVILYVCLSIIGVWGQGQILFYNGTAPTRLFSIDGPLAGPDILGQLLVGTTADELMPVGIAVQHRGAGVLSDGVLTLDGFPCLSSAYVQMLAWDGTLWGDSLNQVPLDQLGRTDIVRTPLGCLPDLVLAPFFTQPAIVPIPEPPALPLVGVAVLLATLRQCLRRRPPT